MNRQARIFVAEIVGTAILVMGGVGTAVLATAEGLSVGTLGVSIAFGLSLLVMVYAIGPVSGCHINPAVTLGLVVLRKVDARDIPLYWIAQLVGAALGGLIVFVIANGLDGFDATNNFGANGWGDFSPGGYEFLSMAVVEIVFTAILVFVVSSTSHGEFTPAASGLAIGWTLGLIHLVTIPVDNTSVNPARSFGAAIFAGSDALTQLWAFIVFPLIGGVLGALVWHVVDTTGLRDREPDKA